MEEGIITNIEDFVNKLITALNNCNINYTLIGGVVALHYGRPRNTQDCDIIISLKEDEIKKFCDCLGKAGFDVKEYDITLAFKEKSHFNAYYKGQYGFRADFSWKRGSLAEHTFQRARKEEIWGVIANTTSPEDLVIAKLIYGSPQDLEDAKAVLRKRKKLNKLDETYLKKRAEEEGVRIQLEKLLKEAEA